MGGALFGFLIVSMIVALIVRGHAAGKAKRVTKLAKIAEWLDGQHDSSSKAWGTKLGPKVTYEFASRGSGESAANWTHIHVEVPPAYPLALHVRRHSSSDRRRVERGEMVDVSVGEQLFDDAFLVEAAPADVVRALFTPDLRSLMLAHEEIDLDTVDGPDGTRVVTLGFRGWIEELSVLAEPVTVMAHLGARVRDAYAQADAAVEQTAAAGDPYRPVADAEPARVAQEAREAEVEKVNAVRADRALRAQTLAMIVMLVIIGATGLSFCVVMR